MLIILEFFELMFALLTMFYLNGLADLSSQKESFQLHLRNYRSWDGVIDHLKKHLLTQSRVMPKTVFLVRNR